MPEEDYEDELAQSDYHEQIIIKQEPEQTIFIKDRSPVQQRNTKHSKPRLTRTVKKKFAQPKTAYNHSSNDTKILDAIRSLKRVDYKKKRDECDIFGEYIANSLRKHDDRTRSMIKHAINNILFEQEMKRYTTTHYEINMDNENPLILPETIEDNEIVMHNDDDDRDRK